MIIGIIGSRRRDKSEDFDAVQEAFCKVADKDTTIVSGGCPQGGDKFAEVIAARYGYHIIIHRAEWKKYGRSAGFKRNTYIARDADILIACVAPDRKGGTEDTIRKYLAMGKDKLILV